MKISKIALCLALALSLNTNTSHAQTLEQTAGIYYAYPTPSGLLTEAPDGYTPVYISHYGRHGSRWITDDYRYTQVYNAFDTCALTPLGEDVLSRLKIVLEDALGRSGSITPLGERQHHDIAQRMANNYPEIFNDTAKIEAVSSTSLRCAMSMSYFTESLKEYNPKLKIHRSAYDKDMVYIANNSPEGKAFSSDTAAWRKDYWQYVASIIDPDRLISSLFADPEVFTEEQKLKLVAGLYWIASDMQNVEPEITFYDIFEYPELQAAWRCINARMYMCNGNAPQAEGVMIHCADNLLTDFICAADFALKGNGLSANLRFGHDTHLLRLLALMGITGCDLQETDMTKFHEVWQDYRFSPMAANLQMVFYSNDEGNILVKILLNEEEVTVNLPTVTGPYYEWQTLKEYLTKRMTM